MDSATVLWDVGANIGLYTCLAASRGATVVSFEASAFNLEALTRNVLLNGHSDLVAIVPIAVSHVGPMFGRLSMKTTEPGGAINLFESSTRDNGTSLKASDQYRVPGLPLDDFSKIWNLPRPTHLKLDVDGNEHLILESCSSILLGLSELNCEIPKFGDAETRISETLERSGLTCVEADRDNQIWVRR
jgi:FkbM family methyltransferase